jgi:hypothetical protein
LSIRDKIMKAAAAIEGNAVLLPDNFDHAIVGYTLPDGARLAVGVYDYDKAACRPSNARECAVDLDLEDALLDAVRSIEGDVKPVIIHTGE